MPKTNDLAKFQPDVFYHVYNRSNNHELLFKTAEHRKIFLLKFKEYLADYLDTAAWCLMGNHFHLLIKVKSLEQIIQHILQIPEHQRIKAHCLFIKTSDEDRNFHMVIERQFTRFFTAYAMLYNHEQKRRGNLFYRPFKRIEITNENHLVWVVYYIHSNPLKHKIMMDFTQYPWSSYKTFLTDSATILMRDEVLNWFCGIKRFISFHSEETKLPESTDYLDIERL